MAAEYRVMNEDGTFVVQKNNGGGWEPIAWTDDIKLAKEIVHKYRSVDE